MFCNLIIIFVLHLERNQKKMILGGQQVQGPAYIVHGDYTLTSAPDRFSQLSKPVGKNDTLRQFALGKSGILLSPDTVNETLEAADLL